MSWNPGIVLTLLEREEEALVGHYPLRFSLQDIQINEYLGENWDKGPVAEHILV